MTRNLILVGNPNTGKTTLFNTMTKSYEKASNWHGVTVGIKSKNIRYENLEYKITDLPGLYSLNAYSNEEKIAVKYLSAHKNDLIINICDANNIKRNLSLTLELLNAGYKILLIVNMNNEARICNYNKLSNALNIDIIQVDARKLDDVNKIFKFLNNSSIKYKTQINKFSNKKYIELIKNNKIFSYNNPYFKSDKIDKILLNKFIFIPLFLIVIFFIFYITFGFIGNYLCDFINTFFNKIANIFKNIINIVNLPDFIQDFINIGLIDSCLSVLTFLPQVALLMFFMNLIEDVGLMSRFAFMFDGFLKKIGLTGKSLFSIFMGFGCSTSSIITTRNLENDKLRRSTISFLSFIPCSAKLPIILTISSLFFEKQKYLYVFAVYIFMIIISILFLLFQNKRSLQEEFFLIEMPKYRLPNLKKVLNDLHTIIKDFLVKIAKIIIIFGAILWILQNISIKFTYLYGDNFNESLLYLISSKIKFIFKPLGLDNVGIVVALIFGLCAKELIVVSLYLINGVDLAVGSLADSLLSSSSICHFTQTSSIVFLIFVILYSPCISSISAICSEVDKKFAFKTFSIQCIIAYIISFIVNMCLTEVNFLYLSFSIFMLVITIKYMLKFNCKKINCQGDCYACGKVYSKKNRESKQAY